MVDADLSTDDYTLLDLSATLGASLYTSGDFARFEDVYLVVPIGLARLGGGDDAVGVGLHTGAMVGYRTAWRSSGAITWV